MKNKHKNFPKIKENDKQVKQVRVVFDSLLTKHLQSPLRIRFIKKRESRWIVPVQ